MAITAYSEHDGRKRQEPVKYGEIRSLYPRSSRSARRTPTRASTGSRQSTGDEASVIGFNGVQTGLDEIALRHDDNVEAWGDFITTKNLSNQSFSSVSPNGAPELARGGDSETAHTERVGQQEHGRVAAMNFDATVVDLLEFCAASNPLGWSELQLFAADGEPFAALRAATFEHQTAVFRAHSDEKPMRPLPAARIGLKRAHSLGHDIPSW
jgi:hypothetical protein